MQCSCKRGVVSNWDFKCGHCRTKKEFEQLDTMLNNAKNRIGVIRILSSQDPIDKSIPMVCIGPGSSLNNTKATINEYMGWLSVKLAAKDKGVCHDMDLIANLILEGYDVQLKSYVTMKRCHAFVIKDLVNRAVRQELLNPST